MSVVVRRGNTGKYVMEFPGSGVDPIEIDEARTLYDGLHSIKDKLNEWLTAMQSTGYTTGYAKATNDAKLLTATAQVADVTADAVVTKGKLA